MRSSKLNIAKQKTGKSMEMYIVWKKIKIQLSDENCKQDPG